MSFIDSVKEVLPDYAKDTKLNLDAVLVRSALDTDVAMGCAVYVWMICGLVGECERIEFREEEAEARRWI